MFAKNICCIPTPFTKLSLSFRHFIQVFRFIFVASSNFFDKAVNSFRNLYVCVQVFPENRCIVKGVVGRNHVLVDLYCPVGGCAGCLWGKVPAVAAPAEKTERRETHMTKQEKEETA